VTAGDANNLVGIIQWDIWNTGGKD
jgi:hypothetical protein